MHGSGRWQRATDDPRVDASLRDPRSDPPDDPRSLATLASVKAELTEAGHAYQFRYDDRPLGEAEGAFLICGFWLSLAHRQLGDAAASARWFERTLAACGPPGLYSEEYDVAQRQLRGNNPTSVRPRSAAGMRGRTAAVRRLGVFIRGFERVMKKVRDRERSPNSSDKTRAPGRYNQAERQR